MINQNYSTNNVNSNNNNQSTASGNKNSVKSHIQFSFGEDFIKNDEKSAFNVNIQFDSKAYSQEQNKLVGLTQNQIDLDNSLILVFNVLPNNKGQFQTLLVEILNGQNNSLISQELLQMILTQQIIVKYCEGTDQKWYISVKFGENVEQQIISLLYMNLEKFNISDFSQLQNSSLKMNFSSRMSLQEMQNSQAKNSKEEDKTNICDVQKPYLLTYFMKSSLLDIEGVLGQNVIQSLLQFAQEYMTPEQQIIFTQFQFLMNKLQNIDLSFHLKDYQTIQKPDTHAKLFDWVYDFSQIIIHPSNEKPYFSLMQNIEPQIQSYIFVPNLGVLQFESNVAGFQQYFQQNLILQK